MEWQQFVMNLESLNAERVEDVLMQFGARSVTFSDAGNDPILEPAPGDTPFWGETRISGLFDCDTDLDALAEAMRRALELDQLPEYRIETLADREWEREWLKDFGPMRFGQRLWVCPTGSLPADDDAAVVRLDPGLAFGTGTHATTAMCLEWLDSLDLAGTTLLDYGCGSGILAIAALKLGCARAQAMDIDVQAVTATRQNAAQNGVQDRLAVTASAAMIDGVFDIVVANILAGPLAELARPIGEHVAPGGQLALSGILADQTEAVRDAYAAWVDLHGVEYREHGGQTWTRLTGRKRQG